MLYRYQIKFRGKVTKRKGGKWATPEFCEITMIPTKLGRWFGCQLRRGTARRAEATVWDEEREENVDDGWRWWWITTERWVGWRIERMIEAAPIDTIEDMPIELLLEEGKSDGG